MADAAAEQSRVFGARISMAFAFVVVVFLQVNDAARKLSEPVGNDPTHPAIRRSAFPFALFCWGACASFVFVKPGQAPRDRFTRIFWRILYPYACALCLLHIVIAFHLGHGWSHEAAWEHTRQVGGYGDGIFVNYAFALVLLVDALCLCVAFDSYFARPRWLRWTVHGFLAFVVFNAVVVFGSWKARRWFFVWGVLLPAFAVWVCWHFTKIAKSDETQDGDPDSAKAESSETPNAESK